MFEKLIISFKSLENLTYKIMKNGLKFSFLLCIIATLILSIYHTTYSLSTYYIGLALLKLGFYFIIEFIICGFVVDNIKKKLI